MKASNKARGSRFEHEFCAMLADAGFWAHNLADRKNGQPFDVVASKDDLFFAFDCKVCADDRFDLSRIEFNQELAMRRLAQCGSHYSYFALKGADGTVRIASYAALSMEGSGMASVPLGEFPTVGRWLVQWMCSTATR